MEIRYHITRTRNIPSILREGLRPSRKGGQGGIAGFGEHTYGIFFFDTIEEVIEHLGLDGEIQMIFPGEWSLLEVRIPTGYDLHEFEEYPGLISSYTTRRVPASCITVLGPLSSYGRK